MKDATKEFCFLAEKAICCHVEVFTKILDE